MQEVNKPKKRGISITKVLGGAGLVATGATLTFFCLKSLPGSPLANTPNPTQPQNWGYIDTAIFSLKLVASLFPLNVGLAFVRVGLSKHAHTTFSAFSRLSELQKLKKIKEKKFSARNTTSPLTRYVGRLASAAAILRLPQTLLFTAIPSLLAGPAGMQWPLGIAASAVGSCLTKEEKPNSSIFGGLKFSAIHQATLHNFVIGLASWQLARTQGISHSLVMETAPAIVIMPVVIISAPVILLGALVATSFMPEKYKDSIKSMLTGRKKRPARISPALSHS